jgi:hypothetical protein
MDIFPKDVQHLIGDLLEYDRNRLYIFSLKYVFYDNMRILHIIFNEYTVYVFKLSTLNLCADIKLSVYIYERVGSIEEQMVEIEKKVINTASHPPKISIYPVIESLFYKLCKTIVDFTSGIDVPFFSFGFLEMTYIDIKKVCEDILDKKVTVYNYIPHEKSDLKVSTQDTTYIEIHLDPDMHVHYTEKIIQ